MVVPNAKEMSGFGIGTIGQSYLTLGGNVWKPLHFFLMKTKTKVIFSQ